VRKNSSKIRPSGPRSNPVAPTTLSLADRKASSPAPDSLPVNEPVAQALANAGQALIAAANALRGQAFSPVASLSLTPTLTLNELIAEVLRARAIAGRSDRYLRQLRVSLKSFAQGRGRTLITAVTCRDIEKWLNAQEWAPKTARTYLWDVRTLFNCAVRRGYLERNPAAGVEPPVLVSTGPIGVHTPAEVRQVLDTARRADLDVCRQLAIRYFAGVRESEVHRMRETDLKLDHGLLEVPAAKSKTRSRRLVTVQPNLRAWLDLGGELQAIGRVRVREVIKLSKVEWKANAPRHSFVSYHLAQFKKANETALEAGHTEQMTFSNYRALVTPAAAAEYWSILPK